MCGKLEHCPVEPADSRVKVFDFDEVAAEIVEENRKFLEELDKDRDGE